MRECACECVCVGGVQYFDLHSQFFCSIVEIPTKSTPHNNKQVSCVQQQEEKKITWHFLVNM